jgi:hypothetical protein
MMDGLSRFGNGMVETASVTDRREDAEFYRGMKEYEPSHMALELSEIIIGELRQWILLDMALAEMGGTVEALKTDIQKKIDDWDHER